MTTDAVGRRKKRRIEDYDSYITSTSWDRRRHAYYANHPKKCRACGTIERIHLHHHTYARLGCELDQDLVPLCEGCHAGVHKYHREHKGMSLTAATRKFLESKGSGLRLTKRQRPKGQKRKRQSPPPVQLSRPAPRASMDLGGRVRFVKSHPHWPASVGSEGTVLEDAGSGIWYVRVDEHPLSRLGVTPNMVQVL